MSHCGACGLAPNCVDTCGCACPICKPLRQAQGSATVQERMHNDMITRELARLTAIAAVMREMGITRYGDIELGPAPSTGPTTKTEQLSPQDAAIRAREDIRRRALGASGGPVKRLDALGGTKQ